MKQFGREFGYLDKHTLEDLSTLEQDGCLYTQLWRDDIDKFGFCRIQFEPREIVEYVDALSAYDEFLRFRNKGFSPENALDQVSNEAVRNQVQEYNRWAREQEDGVEFCLAAFLGGELESLVCGGKPDRYEYLQESYTGDRRFLLREIIEGVSESTSFLQDRRGDRPSFEMSCEQDIQDLLYAIMKPILPDTRLEEFTPKHAGSSKRVDIVVPEISTVIETKYVRDDNHARNVADELKIDFESYHNHPNCADLIAVVWDEDALIPDTSNFETDLSGSREKSGNQFQIEVEVLP